MGYSFSRPPSQPASIVRFPHYEDGCGDGDRGLSARPPRQYWPRSQGRGLFCTRQEASKHDNTLPAFYWYCITHTSGRSGRVSGVTDCGVATFADGRVATMGFFTPEGKPIDWARAARNCESAYRHRRATELMKGRTLLNYREAFARRYHAVTVPPIVALYEETTGEMCELPETESQRQAA